jgi:hypothetical protein
LQKGANYIHLRLYPNVGLWREVSHGLKNAADCGRIAKKNLTPAFK